MLLSANISGIYDGEKASKKRATFDTADFLEKVGLLIFLLEK